MGADPAGLAEVAAVLCRRRSARERLNAIQA